MATLLSNRIKSVAEIARIFLEKQKILESIASVDYVAIFPKNSDEHNVFESNLTNNGTLLKTTSTGKVFKLDEGINTELGIIYIARLRIYDLKMTQAGYVDCQMDNYNDFKDSVVGNDDYTITHNSEGMEMIMLTSKNIIVYFPSKQYEFKS